jgi:hypothetical protein
MVRGVEPGEFRTRPEIKTKRNDVMTGILGGLLSSILPLLLSILVSLFFGGTTPAV